MANDRAKSRATRYEGAFPCSCHTGDKKESIRQSWFRETYERPERLGLFDQRFDGRTVLIHCGSQMEIQRNSVLLNCVRLNLEDMD